MSMQSPSLSGNDDDLQNLLLSDDDNALPSPTKARENDASQGGKNSAFSAGDKNDDGAQSSSSGAGIRERRAQTDCEGVLPSGKRFIVPETVSVMKCMSDLRVMLAPSTLVWLVTNLLGLSTYFLFTGGYVGNWFFNLYFIIWRLGYNIGIGLLLRWQSNDRWVEKMVKKHVLSNPSYRAMLERAVVLGKKSKDFKIEDYPEEFSAWMVFRFVVMVILAQDVVGYLLVVAINLPSWAEVFTVGGIFRFIVCAVLCIFGLWSKADAHRVIGDYAWYWGDFFFLLDKSLVFDGVFQMFPHPMYTVGYLFMYGAIVFTESYDVFYLSVFGHCCQLVFLVLFENPHIEKTYNSMKELSALEKKRDEILYDNEDGYFSGKDKELVVLRNFNPKRAGDLLLVIMMVYTAVVGLLPGVPAWVSIAQYAIWRISLSGILSYVMYRQSKDKFWSNLFKSPKEAFDNWKPLFNATVTLCNFSFLVCAIRLFSWDASSLLIFSTQMRFASFVIGGILFGLNLYVSFGVYEEVGEYGYFYGDFFLDDVPTRLTYDGIYRYMNNPDSSLGYIGAYGVAIISGSPTILVLAVLSHVMVKAFQYLVEEPHMEKKYGKSEVRKDGGGFRKGLVQNAKQLRSALLERRKKYSAMIDKFKQQVETEKAKYNNFVEDVRADRKAKREANKKDE